VTLIHNGVLVQNNEEVLGQTTWLKWTPFEAHGDTGPIEIQDHGHPVRFRNIWLRNLPERAAPKPEDLKRPEVIAMSETDLDRFTGRYAMGAGENPTRVAITRDAGHLLVKFPFLPNPLVIEPVSATEFAMPHTDGRFAFKVDGEGKATGAIFSIGDGERTLKRLNR